MSTTPTTMRCGNRLIFGPIMNTNSKTRSHPHNSFLSEKEYSMVDSRISQQLRWLSSHQSGFAILALISVHSYKDKEFKKYYGTTRIKCRLYWQRRHGRSYDQWAVEAK